MPNEKENVNFMCTELHGMVVYSQILVEVHLNKGICWLNVKREKLNKLKYTLQ